MNTLERAWYQNGPKWKPLWLWFLLPITLLFATIAFLRRVVFRRGWIKTEQLPVPVIVVGNITVGGTGKTPFTIYLVKLLKSLGFTPGIVSRGYGAKESEANPFPRYVNEIEDVELTGDEPKLLAMRTQVPVFIDSNRVRAVKSLVEKAGVNIVISDDGLQHYKMDRALEIALVDGDRKFGNGLLLPMGPLREPISRLQTVDFTIINSGFTDGVKSRHNSLIPDYSLRANTLHSFTGDSISIDDELRNVHLVSGIGNPLRFEKTAKQAGLNVVSTLWYPDHHKFVESDFATLQTLDKDTDIVVMTEKDAVKCSSYAQEHWYILPIEAVISDSLESLLKERITLLKKQS